LPPHTATFFPLLSPSHSRVEHVRKSRFFQSSELANVSSSVLNSEKMLREARGRASLSPFARGRAYSSGSVVPTCQEGLLSGFVLHKLLGSF
jgi:hypothetical protein